MSYDIMNISHISTSKALWLLGPRRVASLQFTKVRGVRVAQLSAIPSELEVLVEPPAVFKASREVDGNGWKSMKKDEKSMKIIENRPFFPWFCTVLHDL